MGGKAGSGDERSILIVEDDLALQNSLKRYLKRTRHTFVASTCAEAFAVITGERVDVMLADILLPDGQGFELADRVARQQPDCGVIIMTGDGRMDNAIAALQHGAADFLLKPFSFDALDAAIERVDRPQADHGSDVPDPGSVEAWRQRHAADILGTDDKLLEMFRMLMRVANTDVSVLVTGESGTGKELIARALRAGSDRRDKPFVVVNSAAIPPNLMESELFGHVRGAFTGATADRAGCFQSADGGTIFLDEIGELPVGLQAKLLRVLQEKEISPVGSSKTFKVDARVVAATNRDLDEMVELGSFREDLLYRLNVIHVELPPLRARRGDIPELVQKFIVRSNARRDREITGIRDEAMDVLWAYDWPGNIRQLENTLERMVVLRSEGGLGMEDLPDKIRKASTNGAHSVWTPKLPSEGVDLQRAVENFENSLLLQALERTGWNKNRAATLLSLNRTTLVEKLKRKNISGPRSNRNGG